MSSPRHLWSGDWELDSAAAREERERQRRREPVPEPLEPPEPARAPAFGARLLAALLRTYDLRAALLIAIAILLTAAAGYGIASLVDSSGGHALAANSRAQAWLGLRVAGSPLGIVVTDVTPGSPAMFAGLLPGDLITQINNQPVGTVDAVSATLGTLHPGDTVAIQFSRGLVSYTTQATLAKGPSGGP